MIQSAAHTYDAYGSDRRTHNEAHNETLEKDHDFHEVSSLHYSRHFDPVLKPEDPRGPETCLLVGKAAEKPSPCHPLHILFPWCVAWPLNLMKIEHFNGLFDSMKIIGEIERSDIDPEPVLGQKAESGRFVIY